MRTHVTILAGVQTLVSSLLLQPSLRAAIRSFTVSLSAIIRITALSMKPGITGLWQVSGRSDIEDFEEVVKLDVAYIDNWSLWGDVKILFKTIYVVFAGKGAK